MLFPAGAAATAGAGAGAGAPPPSPGGAGAGGEASGEAFLALLRKLDDCLGYVAANPQYADAAQYSLKFRQLQVGPRAELSSQATA